MNRFPRKRPSDYEAIEARAAAWLAQRDAGFTDEDQRSFDSWRNADPRHAAAVARLDAMWTALRDLRDFRPRARAHPDKDLLAPPRRTRVSHLPKLLQATAAAAAITILAIWQWPTPTATFQTPPTQTYTTTAGGYQRVTLPDSSILELNDNSEVRVRFDENQRCVQLARGQAHFTVARDHSRPFLVQTPTVTVRAVGTAFDVRLSAERVEVLVTEGVVQLNRAAAASQRSPQTSSAEHPVLAAGWRAFVPHENREALIVERVPPSQMQQALSWQGPRLVFSETPLSEVVEQFNRRNKVQLSLGDAELGTLPVGGSFRADNVDTFVRLLSSSGDITIERPADDRIVLRKSR